MKERYEGDDEDRAFITEYLENVRRLAVKTGTSGTRPLAEIVRDDAVTDVDVACFEELKEEAVTRLRDTWSDFEGLPLDRCLIRPQHTPEDSGGFHSAYGRGFDQFGAVSWCVTLNPERAPDVELRTIELLRGYIHDSIHAHTLKVFRRVPIDYLEANRPVYRHQYGINFRRPWGTSYSGPDLTDEVPIQINLNLLMDGVTMWLAADALRPATDRVRQNDLNDLERAVLADVAVEWEPRVIWPGAARFYITVTLPTKAFIAYWGGDELRSTLYAAMVSGEMETLKAHFDDRLGTDDAWDRLFKNPMWDKEPAHPLGSPLAYRH